MLGRFLCLGAAVLALSAGTGAAETTSFRVLLGGRDLGSLQFRSDGRGDGFAADLTARFDNTPLSLANGTFTGSSRPGRTEAGQAAHAYASHSAFSRKNRRISILLSDGAAVATDVQPKDEETALSQPEAVPAGVIDPAMAFQRLLDTREGCPATFRYYDGRRVVQLSFAAPEAAGAGRVCHGAYRVVAGPGHLSPLRITALKIDLTYGPGAGGEGGLRELDLSTGPFALHVAR